MSRQSFFYSESPYLQALQGLYKALSSSEALVRLTGLPKTGKSSLCEKLMLYMQHKNFRVVYFRYAVESPDMLRTLLARELDLPNAANFARMLEDVPQDGEGKSLILLFDDAHLLSYTTLLEIYRLMQVQSGAERKLNIVLCGEPLLDQRLNRRTELKTLAMHISHNFMLHPMTNAEIAGFMGAYMKKAGLPEIKLEPAALSYFCRATGGLPGATRTLCNALVTAQIGADEGRQVSKAGILKLVRQVQETAADALPTATENRVSSQWAVLGPVAVVVIGASIGTLYQQLLGSAEVNSVTAVTESSAEVSALDSPFAETPEAVADGATADVTVPAIEQTIPAPVIAAPAVADEPIVISDSDLVLVSAAERGVAEIEIVEPVFEEVTAVAAPTIQQAAIAQPAEIAALPTNTAEVALLEEVEAEIASEIAVVEPETDADADAEAVIETENASVETAALEPGAEVMLVAEVNVVQDNNAPKSDDVISTAATTEVIEPPNDSVQLPEIAAVEVNLSDWMAAWQAQNLNGYFASYHPEFAPRYHPSRERWQADRSRVISNARSIILTMTEFEVLASTPDRVEVQFWLDYASATYKDSTQKRLILEELDGRWLIIEEVNLQVRS